MKSPDLLLPTTGGLVLLGSERASLSAQASAHLSVGHRSLSSASKSRWVSPHFGKVYKGFGTRDVAKNRSPHLKEVSMNAFCRRYLYFYRCRSAHGSRMSSSWRRPDAPESFIRKTENGKENEQGEDWYTKWERHKMKQYEEFVRRAEKDPYDLLFGQSNRLLGWMGGIEKAAAKMLSPDTHSKFADIKTKKTIPVADAGIKSSKRTSSENDVPQTPADVRPNRFPIDHAIEDHEYYIDPISLHKVFKKTSEDPYKVNRPKDIRGSSVDIPVKTFKPSCKGPNCENPNQTLRSVRSEVEASATKADDNVEMATEDRLERRDQWLTQEGFGKKGLQGLESRMPNTNATRDAKMDGFKISTALDRHMEGKAVKTQGTPATGLEYNPIESRKEDVDLLRASDIRASAGLRGCLEKETADEKRARHQRLEEQFESSSSDLETQLAQEFATHNDFKRSAHLSSPKSVLHVSGNNETSHAESKRPCVKVQTTQSPASPNSPSSSLPVAATDKVEKLKSKIVALKRELDQKRSDYDAERRRYLVESHRVRKVRKTDKLLEDEIRSQKLAMEAAESHNFKTTNVLKPVIPTDDSMMRGEGDMASNVHDFANRARWYKRKAPHAVDGMDLKLQQLVKDKKLIREIRSIYEEKYGEINTQHRQPINSKICGETSPTSLDLQDTADLSLSNIVTESTADNDIDTKSPSLDERQRTDSLSTIQKLFNELRFAQDFIKNRRRLSAKPLHDNSEPSSLLASKAYQRSVIEIARAGQKLAKTSPLIVDEMTMQDFSDGRPLPNDSTISCSTLSGIPTTTNQASNRTKRTSTVNEGTDASERVPVTTYRILAFDSSSGKVNSAKTSSFIPFVGEQSLTPLEALNQLHNPGKFLPHLMSFHNKGYDIVSGAQNIIVLKKVRQDEHSEDFHREEHVSRPNPIDGTTVPENSLPEVQTGNFASPTGFVNHNKVTLEEAAERSTNAPRPTDKVRREEEVFSGSASRWQDANSKRPNKRNKRVGRRRQMFKRMFLTGTLTAICCYAVGVVAETMHL